MRRTELKKWLAKKGRTQQMLAYLTGITQSSISTMARSKRAIYVVEDSEGTRLQEIKWLGQ